MPQTITPTRYTTSRGAKVWRVKFRWGGSQRTRSIGQMSEADAKLQAAKIAHTLNRLEEGSLEIPKGVDALKFICSGGEATQMRRNESKSLGDLKDAYLDVQKQSVSEGTLVEYRIRLNAFCEFRGEKTLLDDVSFNDIERFVKHRQSTNSGDNTRRDVVRFFDAYRLAIARGWVNKDRQLIAEEVLRNLTFAKAKKLPKFRTLKETLKFIAKRELSADDLKAVWKRCYLDAAELKSFLKELKKAECPDWLRAMVFTAVYTGARRQELCDLNLADIEDGSILIHQRKAHHKAHSESDREVPMHAELARELARWIGIREPIGAGPLFCIQGDLARSRVKSETARRVTRNIATNHLKAVVGKMKDFKELAGRWHIFRHSFISLCAVQGVTKDQVKAWVGHLSDAISDHYTHLSRDHLNEAMQKLSL